MVRFRRGAFLLFLVLAMGFAADASPVFQNTFNLGILSSGQQTQWENAIVYVEGVYSGLYSNNITINLTFDASPGNGILGQSSTNLVGTLTYAQIKSDLAAHATSPDDETAVANLPAADPTGGAAFWLTAAQAKALGV